MLTSPHDGGSAPSPRPVDTRGLHVLMALAGLWFILSPLTIGEPFDSAGLWNNWSVGPTVAMIALLGLLSRKCCVPSRVVLAMLGTWIAASPWIFGYADRIGRLASSLMIGVFITFCALAGAALTPRRDEAGHDQHVQSKPPGAHARDPNPAAAGRRRD